MTTTTQSAIDIILGPARVALQYGGLLVKDIPAEKFAYRPHPTMNHPAFCIGHLSLYPNRVLEFIGRDDLVVARPGWPELFKAGVACVDDDGRYPPRDDLVTCYTERHEVAFDALAAVDEGVLARPNPVEGRFRQMCPTVGIAVNFMLCAHHMSHLGQISGWRRAMGLPSVM